MIKGVEITLGGKTYVMPPLSLGAIEDMEERLRTFKGGADPESVKLVIDCAHRALRRNYPDITRDDLREHIGLENMDEVMMAVMNVSMLRPKEGEPEGKPVAAAE